MKIINWARFDREEHMSLHKQSMRLEADFTLDASLLPDTLTKEDTTKITYGLPRIIEYMNIKTYKTAISCKYFWRIPILI